MLTIKNISFSEDGKVRQMVGTCRLPNPFDFEKTDIETQCECFNCQVKRGEWGK